MKILEIYDQNAPEKWVRVVELKEGQTLKKVKDKLIYEWVHEGKPVETVFNLNNFLAYCLV